MAACELRIKCCVLESCCSFDGSFPSRSTWCQKWANTRLKLRSFVHSTVSLCMRTNCGGCGPNRSRHFRMLSSWCPYKLFVFAVIMANAPVGFPFPQCKKGLDDHERETLDCFILDYIDYCTVMGWFERKDGCQYDDQSEDGKKQWKKQNL